MYECDMTVKVNVKSKVKYIITTKPELAEKKVNEFLDELASNPNVYSFEADIIPLVCYNGPAMIIGAMIRYTERHVTYYDNEKDIEEPGKVQ